MAESAAHPALRVDVQRVSAAATPDDQALAGWIGAALAGYRDAAELTLRIVDEAESARLNEEYRGIPHATNVLSFAMDMPPQARIPYLGDLVLCAPVVRREALEQGKTEDAHWAHMLVHGTLHLLGYDHQTAAQAQRMEALEARTLAAMGFPNPYTADEDA